MSSRQERRSIRSVALPGACAALLVAMVAVITPVVTAAGSGLPPSINVLPERPLRGSDVEVTGLDFPPGGLVELHLIGISGGLPLGTVRADARGRFRHSAAIPGDLSDEVWELRATGPGDAVAVRLFRPAHPTAIITGEAGATRVDAAADASDADADAAAAAGRSGGTDLVVLLIVAVLVVSVAGATMAGWWIVRRGDRQPGMPAGDDPIWGGSGHPQDR